MRADTASCGSKDAALDSCWRDGSRRHVTSSSEISSLSVHATRTEEAKRYKADACLGSATVGRYSANNDALRCDKTVICCTQVRQKCDIARRVLIKSASAGAPAYSRPSLRLRCKSFRDLITVSQSRAPAAAAETAHALSSDDPMRTLSLSASRGAACGHTTATISHTRPSPRTPRSISTYC